MARPELGDELELAAHELAQSAVAVPLLGIGNDLDAMATAGRGDEFGVPRRSQHTGRRRAATDDPRLLPTLA